MAKKKQIGITNEKKIPAVLQPGGKRPEKSARSGRLKALRLGRDSFMGE